MSDENPTPVTCHAELTLRWSDDQERDTKTLPIGTKLGILDYSLRMLCDMLDVPPRAAFDVSSALHLEAEMARILPRVFAAMMEDMGKRNGSGVETATPDQAAALVNILRNRLKK